MNPRTIARLQARIQERAAYCLQFEVNDPRASFITITRVELSPDLASGKIHYSVLGDEGDKANAAHMLKSAAGFIQRQVARVLSVRRMPHLRWVFDDSLENAQAIDALIREARARDAEINPALAAEVSSAVPADSPAAGDVDEALEDDDLAQDPDDDLPAGR